MQLLMITLNLTEMFGQCNDVNCMNVNIIHVLH